MRLVRIGEAGAERPGVVIEGSQFGDASSYFGNFDQEFFADQGIERLRRLLDDGALPIEDIGDQRIGSPVGKPYQVLCIGLNYSNHIAEVGLEIPEEPTVFNKGPRTVIGPNDDVLVPPGSDQTDWEVELAVVIGSEARYLPDEESARRCIAGYAISNDLSERHFQLERGGQWVKGKSCETFNPLGPWLATSDEIANPQDLQLSLSVNGQLKQSASTSSMIFSVDYLVWYLSQFMILEPGDVINTGTPAGVALGQEDKAFLKDGDVMDVAITGLGKQRQTVRQASR